MKILISFKFEAGNKSMWVCFWGDSELIKFVIRGLDTMQIERERGTERIK